MDGGNCATSDSDILNFIGYELYMANVTSVQGLREFLLMILQEYFS